MRPGRKLSHVQARLEVVFRAKRARRTTVTVEPLPHTGGGGKHGVFKATACGFSSAPSPSPNLHPNPNPSP